MRGAKNAESRWKSIPKRGIVCKELQVQLGWDRQIGRKQARQNCSHWRVSDAIGNALDFILGMKRSHKGVLSRDITMFQFLPFKDLLCRRRGRNWETYKHILVVQVKDHGHLNKEQEQRYTIRWIQDTFFFFWRQNQQDLLVMGHAEGMVGIKGDTGF